MASSTNVALKLMSSLSCDEIFTAKAASWCFLVAYLPLESPIFIGLNLTEIDVIQGSITGSQCELVRFQYSTPMQIVVDADN